LGDSESRAGERPEPDDEAESDETADPRFHRASW
jgi:hypothetical protein